MRQTSLRLRLRSSQSIPSGYIAPVRAFGAQDLCGSIVQRAVQFIAISAANAIQTAGIEHTALKAVEEVELTLGKAVFGNKGHILPLMVKLHDIASLAHVQKKTNFTVVAVNYLNIFFFSLAQRISAQGRHLSEI